MAYEQNDNSGSLFKNEKREKDTSPNAKGTATVNGVQYWVSAWTKTGKNGEKYQSLSFQAKQPKDGAVQKEQAKPELNDDIPF